MTAACREVVWILAIACALCGCHRVDWSSDTRQAVDAHLARVKRFYEQRDYTGAISAYEEILRIQPNHPVAHFKIACIYDRNLNDYLNAAYHYQRFLQSPTPDPAYVDLARSALENVKLQLAATVPNAGAQGSPELVRLRSENAALHRQIEDLKREIVQSRGKRVESARGPGDQPPSPPLPVPAVPVPTAREKPFSEPSPARSKTYVVKKGEGIQAIAEKAYGDRSKWRAIVAANPGIKDPNQLKPGQVLLLP